MWQSKGRVEIKKGDGNGLVAVAIDKDKGSQAALKWTVENLLKKGQPIILVHVVQKSASKSLGGRDAIICDTNNSAGSPHRQQLEKQTKDLFLSFHCYCTRKDIQCIDVILEDVDVVKSLTEYASYAAIQNLVLGSPSKHGFIRFKASSIPSSVSKGAPDFCTVYVISKGKISSVRNASRPAPYSSPLLNYVHDLNKDIVKTPDPPKQKLNARAERPSFKPRPFQDESIRSPFARGRGVHGRPSTGAFSESDTDISFISSSDRASTDRPSSVFYDYEIGRNARLSTSSDSSFGSFRSGPKFSDLSSLHDVSSFSQDSGRTSLSWSSQNMEDVEAEMRRLKLELKQTIDMYSAACREALTAKQKEMELNHLRFEEERKLEEARLAEEAALALAEKEKARAKAALEAAEAAKKIAEVESQRRASAENKSLREVKEMKKLLDNLAQSDGRYRRYAIEEIEIATDYFADSRKIGEGGYGPVFKCYLDHTPVAVKVLRPDAAQGRSQFQQEVDILSCIRHPNMVLLLGACPEYGILVYEHMANGSLDDRLFRRGNTTVLPWQIRFRIAAEIATGLLFLHQTKPEPLVHRDLKPGNILLDYNYVSKISDVGLARLVPAVAENVTQYHMTSTAGTFCYIDPEYQQTGMLGVKSDVYSLGIMLLQIITAKPPMGLAHHIQICIERDKFAEMLDPAVTDWPLDETLTFAKLALQCSELRRKDRPDLGTEILPLLSKLRDFAYSKMNHMIMGGSVGDLPHHHHVVHQEVMSDPLIGISNSSISSLTGGTHSGTE